VTSTPPSGAICIRRLPPGGRDHASQFLKEAAPLCGALLSLYLSLSPDGIEYGVCPVASAAQYSIQVVSVGAVIVRSPSQTYIVDFLCQFPDGMESYDDYRRELSRLLQLVNSRRMLVEAAIQTAQKSHGFLIAISRPETAVTAFKHEQSLGGDWIPVEIPDDLNQTIVQELLTKFLSSDGVTVLDPRGHPIGFRGFSYLPPGLGGEAVVGGARKRAFRALRHYVDEGVLLAAFYQSQDGPSQFYQRILPSGAGGTPSPDPEAPQKPPPCEPPRKADVTKPNTGAASTSPPRPTGAEQGDKPALTESAPVEQSCRLNPSQGPTPVWVYVRAHKDLRDIGEVQFSFGETVKTTRLHCYQEDSAGFQLSECPPGPVFVKVGDLTAIYNCTDVDGPPIVSFCRPYAGQNWTYIHGANFRPGTEIRLPTGEVLETHFYSQNQLGVAVPDGTPLKSFELDSKKGVFKYSQ
jgi:hypothetical protein